MSRVMSRVMSGVMLGVMSGVLSQENSCFQEKAPDLAEIGRLSLSIEFFA